MFSIKPSAGARTRRRLRSSLWLACALSVALPAWLGATLWLLDGALAVVAGLAPVAAYISWRVASDLTDENDIGISQLDRIWIYVEKYLPNAAVRRVAWRTVRSVAVLAVLFASASIGVRLAQGPEAPPPDAILPAAETTPEAEYVIEPRQITGLFAVKVDSFPQMAWPAYGTIAALYGSGNPYGIDIYVGGDGRVRAAARGSVVYAGQDVCCGYGYTVVLEHEDGWNTTYGHLATMTVRQGERIKAGDTLGAGGAPEGQARSMHFQVQRNGRAYDPLNVLPASQMGLPSLPGANQICGPEAITLDANSVVNLALTSAALIRYELDAATVTSTTEGAANIEAGVVGLLSLILQMPPSPDADYVLHLSLHKPDDRIAIDCALALRNATDVPLSVEPPRRETLIITPTPFGGPPTPTPLPNTTPLVTPTPGAAGLAETRTSVRTLRPSPTPFQGSLLRMESTPTSTRTPNPKAPKPAGTVRPSPTPTPVKAPTQTFPKQYDSLAGPNATAASEP